MGLSKSIQMGNSFRSGAGLYRLPAIVTFLLMLLFYVLQQQHQYRANDPSLYNGMDNELMASLETSQRRKQQLHRRMKHKTKIISKLAQAAGRNQHINDLRTSWGNDNLLLRQQHQNHHSISIGKNNDIFPIESTLQETKNEYRYNYWTTRHRRHHKGKGGVDNGIGNGHGKGKGKGRKGKGKGKGESELNCFGKGGSSKSKSKSYSKSKKGKGSRKSKKGKGSSKSKSGSGKGKGKRRLKGKGWDDKGKVGKGKGEDEGEETGGKGKGAGTSGKGKGGKVGKGKGGGKGGKGGKGKGGDIYYDDDGYGNDECYEDIIRPPFAPPPTTPAPTSPPIITTIPAPVTTTTTPIVVPTGTPIVPPTTPVVATTNAPSGMSMTTTGPTPERGLVSIRVSDWYIAFRAPDAITRAPTREEYELVLEGTRVYIEMYFQNYFLTNMLNNVIYVRTDGVLGNAAYGLDVPTFVPQPSMMDDGRINIYVQFRYVEFFYVDTSTPIPDEMESYDFIQNAISDMESTYIAQVPQTLTGTPFESTIDIVLDRVP